MKFSRKEKKETSVAKEVDLAIKEIELIDLDREAVEEEIKPINEDMDTKYRSLRHTKKTFPEQVTRLMHGRNSGYIKLLLGIVLLLPFLYYMIYIMALPKIKRFSSDQLVDYKGIVVNISMSDDLTLDYKVENATVKIGDNKYIEIGSDTIESLGKTDLSLTDDGFEYDGVNYNISKELNISTLDCYDGTLYAVYLNAEQTGMREVLVSRDLPSALDIDGLESVDEDVYESNSDTMVRAYKRSYDNSVINYVDQILGGKLGTKTVVSRVKTLESSMNYSVREEGQGEEVTLDIDELGEFKLSSMDALKDAPGIYFSYTDGVLRLYNYLDDMAYVFISYVNNQMFFCNADDLLETNYENLYVTSGFDDEESAGYRTFVITTDNNMYAFRVNSEADSSVVTQLLAMFGYDRDSLEIKTVQEMVSVESVNESLEASSTSIQTDEADSESSETTDENEEVVAADTDVTDSTSSVTK